MLTIAWCQAVLVKNLLEHLIYKRGIGHTGIYKKLCFRLRSPNWHSRGCKQEQLYTSPETPVIGWTEMSSGPSWCLPEYVALYQKVSLSPLSQLPGVSGTSSESSLYHMRDSCLSFIVFLSSGYSVSGNPLLQPGKWLSVLHPLASLCSLLFNTLKATSTYKEFIPNAPFNFCDLLLISGCLA